MHSERNPENRDTGALSGRTGPTSRLITNFDGEHRTVVEAVVDAVANASGMPATEMAPLQSVVDCDAVDALFAAPTDGAGSETVQLRFQYEGYEVTVTSGGRVAVSSS
jgi:hypothetical protein